MNENYKTIYVDPPWPEKGGGKIKRGADKHYNTLSIPQIKGEEPIELDGEKFYMDYFIEYLTDEDNGTHLYLWTTNNYLKEAFEIIEYWGYNYITTITWVKNQQGLGQYYRGLSEHCLFARTDEILPYRELDNGKRAQGKTAFFEEKGKHSQKPEKMREWIEKVSHPPRVELFAREPSKGWDIWGKEVSEGLEIKKSNDKKSKRRKTLSDF